MAAFKPSQTSQTSQLADVIVVGLGGHGASAVAHLARRGLRVIGLERFDRCHGHGSSHGKSRVIRQAYFEDARYVPLLRRAYQLWRELAEFERELHPEATETLFNMTGGLMIGQPDSLVVKGTLESAATHNLPVEVLSAAEIRERFPVFQAQEPCIGVFETEAGYLIPEACIDTYLQLAASFGAELHFHEPLLDWTMRAKNELPEALQQDPQIAALTETDRVVVVTTEKATYYARKIVLSVGAWAPEVYGAEIATPLHVERRVLFWFEPTERPEEFQKLPVYIWNYGIRGNFYGFPMIDESGAKVAFHMYESDRDTRCTPTTIDRTVAESEVEAMREVLAAHMPWANGKLNATATCMYTVTPDEHFLIDFLPSNPQALILSPCSGHGFKFCSVIGEIAADLISSGVTSHDISLFRLR